MMCGVSSGPIDPAERLPSWWRPVRARPHVANMHRAYAETVPNRMTVVWGNGRTEHESAGSKFGDPLLAVINDALPMVFGAPDFQDRTDLPSVPVSLLPKRKTEVPDEWVAEIIATVIEEVIGPLYTVVYDLSLRITHPKGRRDQRAGDPYTVVRSLWARAREVLAERGILTVTPEDLDQALRPLLPAPAGPSGEPDDVRDWPVAVPDEGERALAAASEQAVATVDEAKAAIREGVEQASSPEDRTRVGDYTERIWIYLSGRRTGVIGVRSADYLRHKARAEAVILDNAVDSDEQAWEAIQAGVRRVCGGENVVLVEDYTSEIWKRLRERYRDYGGVVGSRSVAVLRNEGRQEASKLLCRRIREQTHPDYGVFLTGAPLLETHVDRKTPPDDTAVNRVMIRQFLDEVERRLHAFETMPLTLEHKLTRSVVRDVDLVQVVAILYGGTGSIREFNDLARWHTADAGLSWPGENCECRSLPQALRLIYDRITIALRQARAAFTGITDDAFDAAIIDHELQGLTTGDPEKYESDKEQ